MAAAVRRLLGGKEGQGGGGGDAAGTAPEARPGSAWRAAPEGRPPPEPPVRVGSWEEGSGGGLPPGASRRRAWLRGAAPAALRRRGAVGWARISERTPAGCAGEAASDLGRLVVVERCAMLGAWRPWGWVLRLHANAQTPAIRRRRWQRRGSRIQNYKKGRKEAARNAKGDSRPCSITQRCSFPPQLFHNCGKSLWIHSSFCQNSSKSVMKIKPLADSRFTTELD